MSDINDRGRGHDPAPKRHAEEEKANVVAEPAADAEEGGEAIIDRSGALVATHAPDPEHEM